MSEMTRPGASVASHSASATDCAQVNGRYPRAVYVGTAGDVTIVTPDGASATFNDVPGGTVLPVQCKRITAGSDLVLIY